VIWKLVRIVIAVVAGTLAWHWLPWLNDCRVQRANAELDLARQARRSKDEKRVLYPEDAMRAYKRRHRRLDAMSCPGGPHSLFGHEEPVRVPADRDRRARLSER